MKHGFIKIFVQSALMLGLIGLTASAQGDYYGFKIGNKWAYSNNEVQTVTGERVVKKQKVLVVSRATGGRINSEDYMQVGAQGVLLIGSRYGKTDYFYTPPLVVYPAGQLTVGQTWSSSATSPLGSFAFSSQVRGSEGVVTPAGRFNALVVRNSVTTSSGAATVQDAYFVPGAGVVRFVTSDGSNVDLTSRK